MLIGYKQKCLNCPNFDVCSACFSITREQHPEHGFVKVVDTDSLHVCAFVEIETYPSHMFFQLRGSLRDNVVHNAACNECHQPIRGTRYKVCHVRCNEIHVLNVDTVYAPTLRRIRSESTYTPAVGD